MRIARIQVDAFMGVRGLDVGMPLPGQGGLVVIEGPNEAGKTTLLRFVRQMLFGGSEEIRGALILEHEGRRYRLVRTAKGKRYALQDLETGATVDLSLDALVGHLDAKVYQSVFAFGLEELRSFSSLTAEDVQERIYSASVVGAGRSARSALRSIETEMEELLLPRATSARLARLAAELKGARGAATAARARAREYVELREREHDLGLRAEAAQVEMARLQADKVRLEKVLALWPDWRERLELIARLEDAATDAAHDPAWLAAGGEVIGAANELGAHEQRLSALRDLDAAILRLAKSVHVALARLGEGWDEDGVAAFDAASRWRAAAADAARSRASAERHLREAEVRLEAAERNLEAATERSAQAPAPASDEGALAAAEERAMERVTRAAQLEGAWEDRADAERAVHERVAAIAEADALARRGAGRRWLGWALAVGTPVLAAAYLWDRPWFWPAGLVVLAGLIGLLSWPGGVRRGAGAGSQRDVLTLALAEARERRAHVERVIDGISAELDLDPAAGRAAVRGAAARLRAERDRATDQANVHRAAAKAHESALATAHRARDEVAAAREARARKQRASTEVEAAWRSWCERQNVPTWVGPGDLGSFVDAVSAAQEQVLRLRSDRDRRAALHDEVRGFEDALEALRRRLPELVDDRGIAPEGAGDEATVGASASPSAAAVLGGAPLEAEVRAWRGRVEDARRRRAWRERVDAVEARLVTLFGADAHWAKELLDRGEPLAWEAESARLEQAIASVQEGLAGREGLVERRRDAQRAREALEATADLAQLLGEVEVLRAEATEDVRRWLVLRLAADGIEGTLAEYQRDRVPAVLRHAGATLATVTRGRYVGVRQVEEGKLTVVTSDERLVDAASLSRGTQEQLYLALRLGLVDAFAEQRGSLPLVMDDVLVNADPDRSEAMTEVIARTGERHQVLYLTCHPHVTQRLRAAAPDLAHVPLERIRNA